MTQEIIDKLNKDLHAHKQAIDALTAQLDANKQMFNESLNAGFQVRTALITTQRQVQELSNKNAELLTENTDLKAKLPPV